MIRLFDFECVECQTKFEAIWRDGAVINCPVCNSERCDKLPAIFNIAMGAAGAHGYYDETLDKYISTNRQRKEEMRKQGVTEKGDTPKPTGEAWF